MRQHPASSEGLSDPLCACRIHTVPFHPEWLAEKVDRSMVIRPEDCTDADQLCTGWAADGEWSTLWRPFPHRPITSILFSGQGRIVTKNCLLTWLHPAQPPLDCNAVWACCIRLSECLADAELLVPSMKNKHLEAIHLVCAAYSELGSSKC